MASSPKLAALWQRLGYRVVVVCMSTESGVENVSDTLTIYRRKDFFLRDPWNYGIALGFSGFVRRIVSIERPDLILVNKILFWTSLSLISLRLRGKKVVLLSDALVGMTWWPRGFIPRVCAALYAWTIGWLLLLLARRIVFFHPQPKSLLRILGITKKVQVIPTGIDASSYDSATRSSDIDHIRVAYIGRLESVKGVDDYLAALVPLKKAYPQIDIQVIGWYRDGHFLVERFERDVTFTGLRDDIPDILSETDIFVLPSYSEGLSNSLMEAMSSKCACIATHVGGNNFLIQNGVSGFLFPPGDREALAAHVRRLIDDSAKRRNLGEAARTRIDDHFDWRIVGKQYEVLFLRLLS